MNPNHLFPRLSISAKLRIAFLLIALVPLAALGSVGTTVTAEMLQDRIRERLEHDVATAAGQVGLTVREAIQNTRYMASLGLEDLIRNEDAASAPVVSERVATFMESDASTLFRVKAIDAAGRIRLVAPRPAGDGRGPYTAGSEPLYAWVASELAEDQFRILPVELRNGESGGVLPSIALVTPVMDEGRFLGAIVAESRASTIFAGIDQSSPDLEGTTALLDTSERLLYHSERKSDWNSLFSLAGPEAVQMDADADAASAILSGGAGTTRTSGGQVVSFRPIDATSVSDGDFYIYRSVPPTAFQAPVRRYLGISGWVALGATVIVLSLAMLAARQFTRPLLRLQEATNRVAAGQDYPPVEVTTNDEIQDLAEDFEAMAEEVVRHRRKLESSVEAKVRELRKTELELSKIVSLSADAIVSLDPGGRVQTWNRGAEWLFGYTAEEAVGQELSDLIEPEGGQNRHERAYLERTIEEYGAVIAYQTVRRTKSGERIPVGLTLTRLTDDHGGDLGYSTIFRDNRMNERMQAEMRRSERMAAMSVMATGLAHELKNPLAVVRNRIELMQREFREARDGDSGTLTDLKVLQKHVGRIETITRNLFHLAQSGSEDVDEIESINVNDIVERVGILLERVLASKNIAFVTDLEPDLPSALTNEVALETTLVNLVVNAQQAIGEDGQVSVETRRRPDENEVEVEVRDTGPGISDEIRGRIFEPFFTTKTETGGTGLGLAVCRALMERQGATIEVKNHGVDGGASFTLTFQVDSEVTIDPIVGVV